MKVAVVKESAPGERRVALVPETVQKLKQAGLEVLVEKGAGDRAWFPDDAYTEAGATVTTTDNLYATADVVLTVTRPDEAALGLLRPGQAVIGMLAPLTDPHLARTLAERGVTAISLDGLPRTLSRAQGMDALTSQANVAGYKAALVAADPETLAQWKADNGRPETATVAELHNDPALRAEIQAAVDEANKAVSHAEAIKKFVILDSELTEAGGQLTPTFKVRRTVIMQQYAAQIASLYD